MTGPSDQDEISEFYRSHHDAIVDKRERSPHWTRRFAYVGIQERMCRQVEEGARVLDAGCGEGSLAFRLEGRAGSVVGVDLSQPNVEAAARRGGERRSTAAFAVSDLSRLPFPDGAFDVVTCSHVIEHVPDPDAALRELRRVTGGYAVIAMPTCFSPVAPFLLGGVTYWHPSRRSLVAPWVGIAKIVVALIRRRPGPQEGYGGRHDLPHVWRFPWRMIRLVEDAGFRVTHVEGGPFVLPYVGERSKAARRLQEALSQRSDRWPMRWLGYGTHLVVRP
ncbi:MAG TPA: class I SAM-dependent methyltransferase [Acidimicrobiales bacterium]|nr:class I SAM-dependent methyltransferase [Acidimicrobiales bacterium]